MSRRRLTEHEVAQALEGLPGWSLRDAQWLTWSREFGDFDEAMAFIQRVADIARRLDHHPDLYNVYNRVRLELTTHDAGGLTERDVAFAGAVSALDGPGPVSC